MEEVRSSIGDTGSGSDDGGDNRVDEQQAMVQRKKRKKTMKKVSFATIHDLSKAPAKATEDYQWAQCEVCHKWRGLGKF